MKLLSTARSSRRDSGRPSFNALQNVASSKLTLVYYVVDVLILAGRNVMTEPLSKRRDLLQRQVLPKLSEPVRESSQLSASLSDLTTAVKAHGFEGVVAKRLDSRYEPGQRSGAWLKMRVNRGQEFAIGGYTPGSGSFDALIFGYYEGDECCTPPAHARVSRPPRGSNCIGVSGRGKSLSARSRTCQSNGRGAGAWASRRKG